MPTYIANAACSVNEESQIITTLMDDLFGLATLTSYSTLCIRYMKREIPEGVDKHDTY